MIEDLKFSYYNPTQAHTLASRCLDAIPESIVQSLNITAEVEVLTESIAKLDVSLSKTRKSDYTKRIVELDKICDNAVKFMTANSKSFSYSHLNDEREAGVLIYNTIKAIIPNVMALGYVNEMAKIKALYTELQNEKYQAAILLLNFQKYVQHLIDSRNNFEKLYKQKNESEAADSEVFYAKDASVIVLNNLQDVFGLINAHYKISKSADLLELSALINSVVASVNKASK